MINVKITFVYGILKIYQLNISSASNFAETGKGTNIWGETNILSNGLPQMSNFLNLAFWPKTESFLGQFSMKQIWFFSLNHKIPVKFQPKKLKLHQICNSLYLFYMQTKIIAFFSKKTLLWQRSQNITWFSGTSRRKVKGSLGKLKQPILTH